MAGDGIAFIEAMERAIATVVKPLPINIDGALAAVLHDMGFTPVFGRLVFIIGRVAGLTAEVSEELSREKPMRIRIPVEYDGVSHRARLNPPHPMQPTRARYKVLAFTTLLAIITYLDRVAISSAAPDDSAAKWDSMRCRWDGSSAPSRGRTRPLKFPSGWMGDVMGPRKVLTRIVIWWSAFTAATGLAWNFVSLLVARLLFGIGEAGAFPNTSREASPNGFPVRRARRRPRMGVHGHAHGRRDHPAHRRRLDGGVRLAAHVLHVRRARRGLGVVLVALVQGRSVAASRRQRRRARADRSLRRNRRQPRLRFKWSELLTPNLLLVYGMYFTMGYTLYFNLTWLPTYLKDVARLHVAAGGVACRQSCSSPAAWRPTSVAS